MAASILIGIAPLLVAMAVAGYLTWRRPLSASDLPKNFANLFIAALAWQALHFIEELATGFYVQYPQFLGLEPWPLLFFLFFNEFWLGVWLLCLVFIYRGWRPAWMPIWFFALGMTLNGIAHPALALATDGYFPGLVTGPICGVFGIVLLHWLLRK